MSTLLLSQAASLSDHQLVEQVKDLAHQEHAATAALIAHLVVLDGRRLYLAEGCSSLFTYCVEVLHLSEHAAYNRIEAARAARKYPVILERLAAGEVHLTAVRLLVPHLTEENHVALLEEARHLRTRQVEEIVARLQPRPPVPSSIRRLPPLGQHTVGSADPAHGAEGAGNDRPLERAGRSSDAGRDAAPDETRSPLALTQELQPPPGRRPVVEPLAPGQYRVQFTANEETCRDLRIAQDLLRHRIADGDVGKVVKLALRALLRELAKHKHAAAHRTHGSGQGGEKSPGPSRSHNVFSDIAEGSDPAPRSRHIPAAVRRAVWERDGGRCGFVATNGRRCPERGFLEFHHVEPYAVGGPATVKNIELRCRAHNGYETARYFSGGDQVVREPAG